MSDLILHEHCNCTENNLEQLRQNKKDINSIMNFVKEIHKLVSSADMRSRLAYGHAVEADEAMQKLKEKNKKDFEFLMTPYQSNKFKNKTGGIDV